LIDFHFSYRLMMSMRSAGAFRAQPLKLQSPRHLSLARDLGAGRSPERRDIRRVAVHPCQIDPVENVEYVEPKLQFESFRQVRDLFDGQVGFRKSRVAELILFLIPLLPDLRNGEAAAVEVPS
jgi:hypothetical protein